MPPVISVEHLSKAYRLGQIGTGTFANDLKVWWAKVRGKPNPLLKIGQEDHGNRDGEIIWALKDVSFTVEQGEVLGVIGRNGAGKSTLLKILSRITAPTEGVVRVKGRIASLLEVGTGFHPELTGRENIYLNGAILGMSRKEIDRKFDEIVAFAEIEPFIDTPVKRYSSGMYVRLAFAVAAHLDAEILLVDEVLAVGDAAFQKKCLGKMGDVASQEGRTVLFVSHNMAAVRRLCRKSILLKNGCLSKTGDSDEVIKFYNNVIVGNYKSPEWISSVSSRRGQIIRVRLENAKGSPTVDFGIGEAAIVKIGARVPEHVSKVVVGVEIRDLSGDLILNLRSDSQNEIFDIPFANREVEFAVKIPSLPLYPGDYLVEPWFGDYMGKRIDHLKNVLQISISPKGFMRSEKVIYGRGAFLMDCDWLPLQILGQ